MTAAPRVAPVLTPSHARELMCPLLSTFKPDSTIERAPCQAGSCPLWDWVIKPSRAPGDDNEGVGQCSIPRRAHEYADAIQAKAKAKVVSNTAAPAGVTRGSLANSTNAPAGDAGQQCDTAGSRGVTAGEG